MTGTRGQTYCNLQITGAGAKRKRATVKVGVRTRPTADCRYRVAGLEGGTGRG